MAPTGLVGAEMAAGAGMFTLAWLLEGVDVLDVCERDKSARATFDANLALDAPASACDARAWTPPRGLDVLFGGPPCQPWSSAGGARSGGEGHADPRDLFPEVIRATAQSRPRVVVMENVGSAGRGILAAAHAAYVAWWWDRMAREAGYEGTIWRLVSADYGTPQVRPRVMFVAWPKGARWGAALRQPPPKSHVAPGQGAMLGLRPWTTARQRLNAGCCRGYGLVSCLYLNDYRGACGGCEDGSHYAPAPNLDARELTDGERAYMMRDPRRIRRHPPADAGGILPASGLVGPTVVANAAKGPPYGLATKRGAPLPAGGFTTEAHYRLLRRLSVREAAALQDLPAWWTFAGHYRAQLRQVGNGVPLHVGRAVARHVVRALGAAPPPDAPGRGLWSNGCD